MQELRTAMHLTGTVVRRQRDLHSSVSEQVLSPSYVAPEKDSV